MTAITAALASEMITAMMPMTTSNSITVKAGRRAGRPGRGSMARSLITRAELPVVEVAEVVAALGRLVVGHLGRPQGSRRCSSWHCAPDALDDRHGRALAEE